MTPKSILLRNLTELLMKRCDQATDTQCCKKKSFNYATSRRSAGFAGIDGVNYLHSGSKPIPEKEEQQ